MRLFTVVLILTLLVCLMGSAEATTIYVNTSGWWIDPADFNASSTPIQSAIDNATAGDVIIVYPGIYTENVDVSKSVTIRSYSQNPADTIVQAANANDDVFYVTANNVEISGFTVKGATGCSGIYLSNSGYGNISNNIILNNKEGIHLLDSNNNIISNNNVSNNMGGGIYLEGWWFACSGNVISNNTVLNNGKNGIDLFFVDNNVISNNTVLDNYRHGIYAGGVNNVILNNNISNNGYSGIYLGGSNNAILNNTILNNGKNGGSIRDESGIYIYYVSNNVIANNTILYSNYGICIVDSNYNTITSNNISNNRRQGIFSHDSHNNIISNNIVLNNNYGIQLGYSSSNTISNNNVSNNNYGIYLGDSNDNIITNNFVLNGTLGIYLGAYLHGSSNNTLYGNTMTANTYNFGIDGYYISNFIHTIATNNTVDGKPIYYLVGVSDLVIDTSIDVGFLGIVNGVNITVKDLTLTNNVQGVLFFNISNSSIENVTVLNNKYGIYLGDSHNNVVTNNTAINNDYGIKLDYCSNNTISNNNALDNNYGIICVFSDYNVIENNNASNNKNGIRLISSGYNVVSNNIANSNNNYGIYIHGSNNTVISNIASSNNYGVYIYGGELHLPEDIYVFSHSNYNIISNNVFSNNNYGIYLYYSRDFSFSNCNYNTLSNNVVLNNTQWDVYISGGIGNTFTNITLGSTTVSFTYFGDVAVKRVTSPPLDPPGWQNIGKYLNITSFSDNAWVFVNFSYTDAEVSGLDENTLKIWKYNSSGWFEDGWNGTRVLDTKNNIVGVNITSFSIFAPLLVLPDTTPPTIANLTVTPASQEIGKNVTISCEAYDNVGVEEVNVSITYPDGNSTTLSMSFNGEFYTTNFIITQYGTYTAEVVARDTAGNTANASIEFYGIEVVSNTTVIPAESEAPVVVDEDIEIYAKAGEGDASVDVTVKIAPSNEAVNASIALGEANPVKYIEVNATAENVSTVTLKVKYTDKEVSGLDEDSLSLYYWDEANSTWHRVRDYVGSTIPGGPYVYDAGVDTINNYVWAKLNHFSIYALGGLPDSDGDGIPDANDACPYQPENFNGYQDDDGCPDTPPPPTPARGGGGGGGGAAFIPPPLEAPPEVKHIEARYFPANREVTLRPPSQIVETTDIVEIVAKIDEARTLSIAISKAKDLPENVPTPPHKAYKVFEVVFAKYGTTVKVEPSGRISFRVAKDWMAKERVNEITLMKYSPAKAKWIEIPTTKVGEDDNYVYFESSIESFSLFAIVGKAKPAIAATPTVTTTAITETPPAPTTTPTTTPSEKLTPTPPTLAKFPPMMTVLVIAAVIAAIAVVVYLGRK